MFPITRRLYYGSFPHFVCFFIITSWCNNFYFFKLNISKKVGGIFHVQMIEERRSLAMLFFHHTNSSNAPGDEFPVHSLPAVKRVLQWASMALNCSAILNRTTVAIFHKQILRYLISNAFRCFSKVCLISTQGLRYRILLDTATTSTQS